MLFEVFGPYEVPLDDGRNIIYNKKNPAFKEFWQRVDDEHDGLPEAWGCYVFSIHRKGGKGWPYYVGQTIKKKFKGRCFDHKTVMNLGRELRKETNGRVKLFLIAPMTKRGKKFVKSRSKANGVKLDKLEHILIGFAANANSDLLNDQNKNALEVKGVINSKIKGPPTNSARNLKGVLRI